MFQRPSTVSWKNWIFSENTCGLQREVHVSRGDLERTTADLQQKTREAEDHRVEAEKRLQAAHVECKAKVGTARWECHIAKACLIFVYLHSKGFMDMHRLWS